MKVVILCGGMGMRLREETEYKPKPMVEIGERPILWHIMKLFSVYGYREFVLCLGYKQNVIREYFLNYECMNKDFTIKLSSRNEIIYHNKHAEDWIVTLADTGECTKKGTRIKRILPFIDGEEFMITYGDGLSNVNISKLVECHRSHGKIVTFTGVHPISRFATVELDKNNNVVDWHEKRCLEGYVNAGYFVVKKKIAKYLNDDCELEEEPMKVLAQQGQIGMYRHEGYWHCMDTYRDYNYLNDLWLSHSAPWKVWK
jgi:glucose-1-phosphate cytidylyltransferase